MSKRNIPFLLSLLSTPLLASCLAADPGPSSPPPGPAVPAEQRASRDHERALVLPLDVASRPVTGRLLRTEVAVPGLAESPRTGVLRQALGGEGAGAFSSSTLSGFVTEAGSGRSVDGATVTTDPPTSSVTSNLSGLYVMQLGTTFGALTVRAAKPGHVQVRPTCVILKPGLNTLADVVLAREEDLAGAEEGADCVPACAAGNRCVRGACISRCLPLCACTERCTAAGTCEHDPDAAGPQTCGPGTEDLGGGLCGCQPGLVPALDGRSCIEPTVERACPANSVETATGCECEPGLVPDPSGRRCLPPEDAAVGTPFTRGTEVRRLVPPGRAPRGIATDGETFWIGDALARTVYRVRFPAGQDQPEIIEEIPFTVEGDATVIDLAWAGGKLRQSGEWGVPLAGVAGSGAQLFYLEGWLLAPVDLPGEGPGLERNIELAGDHWSGALEVYDDPRYLVSPRGFLRFLAFTHGQLLSWAGTSYDGATFTHEVIVLGAANFVRARELARIPLPVGGSHVTGLEAYGNRLWLIVGGAGMPEPRIVEVELQR